MDLYFQGLAWANRGPTPDNFAKARSFYDRALTADPDNVDALIGSAWADLMAGVMGETPTTAFAIAEAKVTKALSSAPDHANGHRLLGHLEILTKRAAQGIAECEHALELDRNLAAAHSTIGLAKIFIGRPEETETHILEALRLSPAIQMLTPGYISWALRSCISAVTSRRWRGAGGRLRPTDYPLIYFQLAAALAQLGRLDEAHSAAKVGLALDPAFAIPRARASWRAMSDDPTFLAGLERNLEGLRKAGVPEE